MSDALRKAIKIAGSQSELARRIGGKTRTGHIYHWLTNGVSPSAAPKIAAAVGDAVSCEQLCPDVKWIRDKKGQVTGYHTAIEQEAA
jgi:DNA-binding transcriptional regulator YdaS (Cro superfamily)